MSGEIDTEIVHFIFKFQNKRFSQMTKISLEAQRLDILTKPSTVNHVLISTETKRVCFQNQRHFFDFYSTNFQELILELKYLKVNYFEQFHSLGFSFSLCYR